MLKYPLFSSECNETWILSIVFRKTLGYKISWKSVEWEPSCTMRTDRRTERQDEATSLFAILRTRLKYHRHIDRGSWCRSQRIQTAKMWFGYSLNQCITSMSDVNLRTICNSRYVKIAWQWDCAACREHLPPHGMQLVQLNAVRHVATGIVVWQDDAWSYPLGWGTTECHAMGRAFQHFLGSCCTIDFTPVNKWYAFFKMYYLFLFTFLKARFRTEELLYRQNDDTRAFLLVQGWTKRQYKDIVLTEVKSGRYWCCTGNNIEKILKEVLLAPLCGFRRLQN